MAPTPARVDPGFAPPWVYRALRRRYAPAIADHVRSSALRSLLRWFLRFGPVRRWHYRPALRLHSRARAQAAGPAPIAVADIMARFTPAEHLARADAYFVREDEEASLLRRPFQGPADSQPRLAGLATVIQLLALPPGARVLDFGCGTGWLARCLATMGADVLATDVSANVLALARSGLARDPLAGELRVEFQRFDGTRLPAADASMDRVVSFDAFHHVLDQAATLAEMARVLKPGGVAVFHEPGPRHSATADAQHEMAHLRRDRERHRRARHLAQRPGLRLHRHPHGAAGAGHPRGAAVRLRPHRRRPPLDAGPARRDAEHLRLQPQPAHLRPAQGRQHPVMLFYEPLFLFLFFPVTFAAYLAVRRRGTARVLVLLVASLFFYLWSEPLFVPVVLLTCVTDFLLARLVAGGRRWALPAGVLINLGMLVYYKYTGFAVDNLDVLLVSAGLAPWHVGQIALPIGVSFIVFEKITYLVDIARRRSKPAPDFATYLLYVFLFPKLLAGPIIKYHELEAQLLHHGRDRQGDLVTGLRRFMLGVVKKTIVADTLAAGADMTFAADPAQLGSADAWWGVLFFTFQIYIDFSAYSDMAIGLARMFGFRLNENFDKPYISCSITEFWRRWHISLSTWIRDYLYIPLGGNRVPPWRRYLNLWVCFLASGLWHGAAWTYVIWGAYNGMFLVLERLFLLRTLDRMPRLAANAWTFAVTVTGWLVFRATSLSQVGGFLDAMMATGRHGTVLGLYRTPLMAAMVGVAALISFLPRVPGFDRAEGRLLAAPAGRAALDLALSLLFVFALAKALADPFKPFLYFRF